MNTEVTVAGATVRVFLASIASMVDGYVIGWWCSFKEEKIVIGLDVEWTSTDPNNRVAILQLCHKGKCLIVQMAHLDYIPQLLEGFLADRDVTFVGVGITGDISKLQRDHGLNCHNAVEIGPLAAEVMGDRRLTDAGLVQLASEVLGLEVKKNTDVALYTDWSDKFLCDDQIVYATTDAYVSYLIGAELLGKK